MYGINILAGSVFMLPQCILNCSAKAALGIRLSEANVNLLSANLSKFSTFHYLLKRIKIVKNNYTDSPVERRQECLGSVANASRLVNVKKTSSVKVKSLMVRPEINYNDLQIKVKQIQKFLSKGISVAVKVENAKNREGALEEIFDRIQKSITENRIAATLMKTGPIINIYPALVDSKGNKKNKEEKVSSCSENNRESEDKS